MADDDECDDHCNHDDYDVDILEGRARCHRCGESWYVTEDEVLRQIDHEVAYAAWEESENRRQWWRDLYYKLTVWLRPYRKWRARRSGFDDGIPF